MSTDILDYPAIFNYPPTLDLLESLTTGSLKQNLPKTLRLWVMLRSIYGDDNDPVKLPLDDQFTYLEWRDLFFLDSKKHHQKEFISSLHDSQCPCAKTLKQWLLEFKSEVFNFHFDEWYKSFQEKYFFTDDQMETVLNLGIIPNTKHSENKQKKEKLQDQLQDKTWSKRFPLADGRLFAVTSRSLKNDLKTLVEKGWLTEEINYCGRRIFHKVENFPFTMKNDVDINKLELGDILHPDLATTFKKFGLPINGVNRFYMHVEFIPPNDTVDKTEILEEELKRIWGQEVIPPIKLTYDSASLWKNTHTIVYPVCIYYYQRALYLCAYGELPKKRNTIGWNNYRLDRIQYIQQLNWQDQSIPQQLFKQYQQGNLPDVEYVQNEIAEAWGLDFYQESAMMLLRYNEEFHDKYIEKTYRHCTFEKIPSIQEVEGFIKQQKLSRHEESYLLKIIKDHPEDAYYKARFRVYDNNVIMRLRAWNPNLEVLLPLDLRRRMIDEILQGWKMYHQLVTEEENILLCS